MFRCAKLCIKDFFLNTKLIHFDNKRLKNNYMNENHFNICLYALFYGCQVWFAIKKMEKLVKLTDV